MLHTMALLRQVFRAGSDETGLGLNQQTDHEINVAPRRRARLFEHGDKRCDCGYSHNRSIQSKEGFGVFNSGLTQVASGTGGPTQQSVTLSLSSSSEIYYVSAIFGGQGSNNVLIDTAVVTTPTAVPEPSTLAIAGLGALGFGANAWRRRRTKKA